ncbi:hypothetical protein DPEC_G00307590 [Dallia pectoralis]|uniref:Uncharacterized protein n=1 Tax=Dallia pectoralis TaxID=75939 RepID=A0ACC2FEJ3_DALPE|nr:hypothetical protein DPEC_G00307590 [Dallia pectoralis]
MEKCSPVPHCYKGYSMPPGSQYARQMGSHSSLKQGSYRPAPQNNYSYQQPPSRGGYEPQPPLQGMPTSQEAHPKYQHFSQPQQNYCLSELSVRSPEQYYQTCSPASSHSPARSVGRSPSYSSTPSPLMTNPESFQYGQPPMTPGTTSSSSASSAGLQDQGLLMPPRSHPSPSPNMAHLTPQHSYTQGGTMKERFSEKLLANPSLWSLNALTSQVENISNNVQQLLLSEALVANKKGGKRSHSTGSSIGSSGGGSSKKGEEYKPVTGGPEGQQAGGPSQDPYSTQQQQPFPMEMQEGGYSSSSDEQLERGYYYCGQGRSPAQALNNTHLGLDTTSSCSMISPDDMSTRSGDSTSGMQNVAPREDLTPDPRSQGGQDLPNIPMKSVGNERSPVSVAVLSPMKQESQSPPDIQRLGEPLKENFEESAWTEKMADDEDDIMKKTEDSEPDCKSNNSVTDAEKQEKWQEDEKGQALYSTINKAVTEKKSYCYDEITYHEIQNKYEQDEGDLVEKSPSLSDTSHKQELLGREMKSEVFKSESTNDSESSAKTSPFISSCDHDQDQYLTEKEDSSESVSPIQSSETLDKRLSSEKRENEEYEEEEEEEEKEERQQQPISPLPSAECRDGEESESLPSTEEVINYRLSPQEEPSVEFCHRTEGQGFAEPQIILDPAAIETETSQLSPAAAVETPERDSAICDNSPQYHSPMPVFSDLNDEATPPASAQSRDHIDHSDAKVMEPDSPQLPGKSILHSAPSWADTPPSPKKGDEDMEPGINCPSAVTPSAKLEPMAPSAQPRPFGRKHTRGRRRPMPLGLGIRRQLTAETEGKSIPSTPQKPSIPSIPSIPSSKSGLFSDQMDMVAHQDFLTTISELPKVMVEGSRSRMCTRSYNTQDTPPKDPQPSERWKPGRKPGAPRGRPRGTGSKSKLPEQEGPIQPIIEGPGKSRKCLSIHSNQSDENQEVTAPDEDKKNMILRSRKPPQDKLTNEIDKEQAEENLAQTLTDATKPNAVIMSEEPVSIEHGFPGFPNQTDTSITDINIPVTLPEKSAEPTIAELPEIVLPQKRKHSPQPLERTVKKKRGPKPKPQQPQPGTLQGDLGHQLSFVNSKEIDERGPKRKLKKGQHLKESLITALAKDNPPPTMADSEVVSEMLSVPPQCLTKTKYLPPRKGRGLKYEAMVQKINSGTSSKKHHPTPQPEITVAPVEEVLSKPVSLSIWEESETPAVGPLNGPQEAAEEITWDVLSSTRVQNTERLGEVQQNTVAVVPPESNPVRLPAASSANKPARTSTKRRRWAVVESTDTTVVAMETGSLIINTPRLAKQRAIKNNHEMHLKQRRKKKGEQAPAEELGTVDKLETQTGDQPMETEAPTSIETTITSINVLPEEITDSPQIIAMEAIQPPPSKRGRKPSSPPSKKRARGRTPGDQPGNKPLKMHRKPGPKKGLKDAIEVIEAVVKAAGMEPRLKKKKSKKESSAVLEENELDPCITQVMRKPPKKVKIPKTVKSPKKEVKHSFCPYVRMDRSRDFASLCTIVNRPNEELKVVLHKPRKKNQTKIKNPVMIAQTISSSTAMLQGPLVNKALVHRCLTCCLCGKPANYRELGDLCGPYYPEDSIPGKILSERHRDSPEKTSYRSTFQDPGSTTPISKDQSSEQEGSKEGYMEMVPKEDGSSSNTTSKGLYHHHHPWRPRRAERTLMASKGPHRVTLRDRFRRMQQLQEERRAAEATGQEVGRGEGGLLQRLQGEAEAKEHWAHENCAIWTDGVIMVAGRLYGLKEAARTSAEMSCARCQRVGASISCCCKGCPQKYHYVCAKEIGCMFQEDNFSLICQKHKVSKYR